MMLNEKKRKLKMKRKEKKEITEIILKVIDGVICKQSRQNFPQKKQTWRNNICKTKFNMREMVNDSKKIHIDMLLQW